MPKEEIAQPLRFLLAEAPQLVGDQVQPLLTGQGIAGDGVGAVQLAGAAIER